MKSWYTLAREIENWSGKNFGIIHPWQMFLGVVEEIGEFEEASAQHVQSVRLERQYDSLGDQAIYALNLQNSLALGSFVCTHLVPTRGIIDIQTIANGARVLLKHSQGGIRGCDYQKLQSEMCRFLGVWWAWAVGQTVKNGLPPMLEITNQVWDKVSKRDWKKNPHTGT